MRKKVPGTVQERERANMNRSVDKLCLIMKPDDESVLTVLNICIFAALLCGLCMEGHFCRCDEKNKILYVIIRGNFLQIMT